MEVQKRQGTGTGLLVKAASWPHLSFCFYSFLKIHSFDHPFILRGLCWCFHGVCSLVRFER